MIKKIRVSKGWSQEQLAEFSGLSVRTIQRLERGYSAVFDVNVPELQCNDLSENEQFLGTNPILPVSSVYETAKFYEEELGFEIEILWENPPYGVVARERATIEFGEGRKNTRVPAYA